MTRDDLDPEPDPSVPPGDGGIAPVRWSVLGLIAAAGGVVALALTLLTELATGTPPQVPWTLPAALALAAGGVAVLAWTTQRRVHVERRWMAASRGIRLLALGRTAVLVGAFAAGFGLVFAALFVSRAAVPVSLVRTLVGAALVVVGIALVVAGRALERACHIPDDDSAPPRAPAGDARGRRLR